MYCIRYFNSMPRGVLLPPWYCIFYLTDLSFYFRVCFFLCVSLSRRSSINLNCILTKKNSSLCEELIRLELQRLSGDTDKHTMVRLWTFLCAICCANCVFLKAKGSAGDVASVRRLREVQLAVPPGKRSWEVSGVPALFILHSSCMCCHGNDLDCRIRRWVAAACEVSMRM